MTQIEQYIVESDEQLVGKALEGDNIAFEHLFTRYREAVKQLYLQRTQGNNADADDLLQETFVKVYLNLGSYNPGYTFGQWIYTIAKNTFVDFYRRRRETLPLESISASNTPLTPSSQTPEESFISSQQRTQLEHHLEKMNPRYRQLIELRFFKQFSYEEIAAHLNLPLGTIKTRIHRAREQLCKSILEHSDIMS